MRKLVVMLALVALAPFALAACGGDDDDIAAPDPEVEEPAPENGAETVRVAADPDGELAFDQESVEVPAGEMTFEFENPASIEHDFVIEDADGNDVARTDLIAEDSDSVTVDLASGEYTFYCSVPGHREGGMLGQLTVHDDQDNAAEEAAPPAEADPPETPGY
jgi:uncharacterized cupredoxin-like copper-binding protein